MSAASTCGCRGAITSTIAWIKARGVKYCPAPDFVSWAFLLGQPLVDRRLHVDIEPRPGLLVDHLDQAPQIGRILDAVLGLVQDDGDQPNTLAQLAQRVPVVALQIDSGQPLEAGPVVRLRDGQSPAELLLLLLGHL